MKNFKKIKTSGGNLRLRSMLGIMVTANELRELFGSPSNCGDNYKVTHCWNFASDPDPFVITLYDYKMTKKYSKYEVSYTKFKDTPYEWHIGASSTTPPEFIDAFIHWIKNEIISYREAMEKTSDVLKEEVQEVQKSVNSIMPLEICW